MDRKLGVAVCGVGWCASQHIAAFLRNPRTSVTWLCARDADRARANLDEVRARRCPTRGSPPATRRSLAAADVDIVSIATPNHLHADQAVAAAEAGKHFVLEKPTGLDVAELVRHSRRRAARRRPDDRVVRAALQPVSEIRALAAERRLARRHPLRAHAVPVARHRLVRGLGLGAHARERAQPPARRRLPRGRCAALVLGSRADRGERVSHALHRRLRMADVDRRQHDARAAPRSATSPAPPTSCCRTRFSSS